MYIYNIYLPPFKRIRDPRNLMKFKHDEPVPDGEEVYIPTEDEWIELDKRLAEIHKKTVQN
jgi:hypothetical protein